MLCSVHVMKKSQSIAAGQAARKFDETRRFLKPQRSILNVALLIGGPLFGLLILACVGVVTDSGAESSKPQGKYKVLRGLEYGRATIGAPGKQRQARLLMDLYLPARDKVQANAHPVILLVHGGGFRGGSRRDDRLSEVARRMVARGYVAASIDYRLGTQGPALDAEFAPLLELPWTQARSLNEPLTKSEERHGPAAAVADTVRALRFLKANAANYGADMSRVMLFGSSAGGITVVNVAYSLDEIGIERPAVHGVVNCWGAPLHVYSKLKVVDAGDPPLFVIHASGDRTVLFAHSQELVRQARGKGVPFEAHPFQLNAHGLKIFQLQDAQGVAIWDRMVKFMDTALNKPAALPAVRCVGDGKAPCKL